MPGYGLLWLVLFHSRVTTDRLRVVLRRTWWLWVILGIIGYLWVQIASNYFVDTKPAPIGDVIQSMTVSLFQTLVPSLFGVYGPSSHWFTTLGTVFGIVVLAGAVVVSVMRSGRAWRGWLFAVMGWLLPSAALALNRVGLWGPLVTERGLYFFLPSMLFMVGAMEAFAASRRAPARHAAQPQRVDDRALQRRLLVALAAVVVAVAYLISAPKAVQELFDVGSVANSTAPERSYVATVLTSADEIDADRGTFSIIDADVPAGLVPDYKAPYNRLSRVIALADPSIRFDAVIGSHWVADSSGDLHRARINWVVEHELTDDAALQAIGLTGADRMRVDPDRGVCFRVVEPYARVVVPLAKPVAGERLVVRTLATVNQPSTERVGVQATAGGEFKPANEDIHQWLPEASGQLDTVAGESISAVAVDSLTVGTDVCLRSVAIGKVVLAGQ